VIMGYLGWIVLGLTAGYLASTFVNNRANGFLLDIGLGIVGAVMGGWLFNAYGSGGVTGLSLWSLLAAGSGAVVLLVARHTGPRAADHPNR